MTKKRPGRPPAGLRGKPSSEYDRLTVRVPDRTLKLLRRLADETGLPQWRIVMEALDAYRPPRQAE